MSDILTHKEDTAPAASDWMLIERSSGNRVFKLRSTVGARVVTATAGATQSLSDWMADVAASGTGDVVGPASSTDNALPRYDGTTGKLLQDNAGWTINDAGHLLARTTSIDIGESGGATRPRDAFFSRNLEVGGTGTFTGVLNTSSIIPAAAALIYWAGRTVLASPSDGVLRLTNNAETGFVGLLLGPSGTIYNRLKHNATGVLELRLADDSAQATWDALAYRAAGTKVVGTQATAVADAAGGATVDAEARTALNALLARLRTHGLIAT